ncbi:hypothetical protein HGRIS_002443 [Hohenbuehelia grisea]|uniref:Telomere replication protein EST3 n=1 Tax=Hohenbuehelia grisea TaxID=104357 RepID=A0ABR3JKG7_9AGAR
MSNSLQPWIANYAINTGEAYGGSLLSVPTHGAPKKVQLVEFLTYGGKNDDRIWAKVSDKEYRIAVLFSKVALASFTRDNHKRLTDYSSALIKIKLFRPLLTRIPNGNKGTGMTPETYLALECDHVTLLGSINEGEWGFPKELIHHPLVRAWIEGLRQDGGAGNILRDAKAEREQLDKPNQPSDRAQRPGFEAPSEPSKQITPPKQPGRDISKVDQQTSSVDLDYVTTVERSWQARKGRNHRRYMLRQQNTEDAPQTVPPVYPVKDQQDNEDGIEPPRKRRRLNTPSHLPGFSGRSDPPLVKPSTPSIDIAPSNPSTPSSSPIPWSSSPAPDTRHEHQHPQTTQESKAAAGDEIKLSSPSSPWKADDNTSKGRGTSQPSQLPQSSPLPTSSLFPIPATFSSLISPVVSSHPEPVRRKVPRPQLPQIPDRIATGAILVPDSDVSGTVSQSQSLSQSQSQSQPLSQFNLQNHSQSQLLSRSKLHAQSQIRPLSPSDQYQPPVQEHAPAPSPKTSLSQSSEEGNCNTEDDDHASQQSHDSLFSGSISEDDTSSTGCGDSEADNNAEQEADKNGADSKSRNIEPLDEDDAQIHIQLTSPRTLPQVHASHESAVAPPPEAAPAATSPDVAMHDAVSWQQPAFMRTSTLPTPSASGSNTILEQRLPSLGPDFRPLPRTSPLEHLRSAKRNGDAREVAASRSPHPPAHGARTLPIDDVKLEEDLITTSSSRSKKLSGFRPKLTPTSSERRGFSLAGLCTMLRDISQAKWGT